MTRAQRKTAHEEACSWWRRGYVARIVGEVAARQAAIPEGEPLRLFLLGTTGGGRPRPPEEFACEDVAR